MKMVHTDGDCAELHRDAHWRASTYPKLATGLAVIDLSYVIYLHYLPGTAMFGVAYWAIVTAFAIAAAMLLRDALEHAALMRRVLPLGKGPDHVCQAIGRHDWSALSALQNAASFMWEGIALALFGWILLAKFSAEYWPATVSGYVLSAWGTYLAAASFLKRRRTRERVEQFLPRRSQRDEDAYLS